MSGGADVGSFPLQTADEHDESNSVGSSASSEVTICNLLYRFAELMDRGLFEALGYELFTHCRFVVAPPPAEKLDGRQMVALIDRTTIRYPDGTPRTKHLITNPIVEVDEGTGKATCRSYYTILQQTEGLPMQVIVSGRYEDDFERDEDGHWRFAERDLTLVDMVGNLSQHVRFELAVGS